MVDLVKIFDLIVVNLLFSFISLRVIIKA